MVTKPDDELKDKVKTMIWEDPSFPAKFSPYLKDETIAIIPRLSYVCSDPEPEDSIPVPPQELWDGHWSTPREYVDSGKRHFDTMMNIVYASGFSLREKGRILDLGCGTGRIIRCFKRLTQGREVWGADIRADHILWSNQHLCPPYRFVTVTAFPHLPFEDRYFDLIYAGSVFTHISDLVEAWLLELKRILNPEGRCYITIRDNHSIGRILSSPPAHPLHQAPMRQKLLALEEETHFLQFGFSTLVLRKDPLDTQVFYDEDFLRKSWGSFFRILSVSPEAFGYETAILLGK